MMIFALPPKEKKFLYKRICFNEDEYLPNGLFPLRATMTWFQPLFRASTKDNWLKASFGNLSGDRGMSRYTLSRGFLFPTGYPVFQKEEPGVWGCTPGSQGRPRGCDQISINSSYS